MILQPHRAHRQRGMPQTLDSQTRLLSIVLDCFTRWIVLSESSNIFLGDSDRQQAK